jgi:predicted nucleic acid-binding protein
LRRWYADSSALVKLVTPEPETAALAAALRGTGVVASALVRVEVTRAARRLDPELVSAARAVLARVTVLAVDDVLLRAADLRPTGLRSLDALHLATAVRLLPRLDGFLCYDPRLVDAAHEHGLLVPAPG